MDQTVFFLNTQIPFIHTEKTSSFSLVLDDEHYLRGQNTFN